MALKGCPLQHFSSRALTDNNQGQLHLGIHQPADSKHVCEWKTGFYLNVEGSEACDDLEQVVSQKQVPDDHNSKNIKIHCEIAIITLELDLWVESNHTSQFTFWFL